MNKLLNLLALAVTVSASNYFSHMPVVDNTEALVIVERSNYFDVNFRNWVIGFKGLLSGYRKGLYDDEMLKLDKDCFGTVKVNADLKFMH